MGNGAFDPKTMGACPNVGLMAQKAEEYGSHPNTFEAPCDGTIRVVVNGTDQVLLGHAVKKGDIYRACQTKDGPIKDWVKLAVNRCRANNFPRNDKPCKAIFWLDSARTHDVVLMERVRSYLPEFNPAGLDIDIMSPVEAMRVTLQRAKEGLNTITDRKRAARLPYRSLSHLGTRHQRQDALHCSDARGWRHVRDWSRGFCTQARTAISEGRPSQVGFSR